MHYFFKNLLLYSQAQIRQTEGIVMMSQEGFNKIVNFMNPRAGILVLGWGHVSDEWKYIISLKISFYPRHRLDKIRVW